MARGETYLPVVYSAFEVTVAVLAIVGNSLVVAAFVRERRLRKLTNFYILSLAVSDLLVGLVGVPSAILTKMGMPQHAFGACLLMLSLLVVLCTISILNLCAVTLDRYWAIIHPFCYKRLMSGNAVSGIIIGCWVLGTLVGLLPLFGWNNGPESEGYCLFIPVMNYDFLVLIYFGTIVYPAVVMAFCYGRIYVVVIRQIRQISSLENVPSHFRQTGGSTSSRRSVQRTPSPQQQQQGNAQNGSSRNGIARLRPANRREVKTAKNLSIIIIFFLICWVPLYTVNTVQAFCSECTSPLWLLDCFIVLSHANSAVNPFLYAYHLRDFRRTLKRYVTCGRWAPSGSNDSQQGSLTVLNKAVFTVPTPPPQPITNGTTNAT